MSTTTLSQRLREIASNIPTRMSMNDPGWSPCEVAEMISAIAAQAEAQEAQAGELSDEDEPTCDEIEAWLRSEGYALTSGTKTVYMDGAPSVLKKFLSAHRPKPSQAIGEQTPVAWCVAYDGPGANEGRRVHSNPTMHKQEAEELAQRTGLALVSLYPSPVTPEARDRAIEALDLSKEALPYAYDDRNGNTVTPWNLEVTRAIKKVDQAISALRGS